MGFQAQEGEEKSFRFELGKEQKNFYLADVVKAPLLFGHQCTRPTKSFPAFTAGEKH